MAAYALHRVPRFPKQRLKVLEVARPVVMGVEFEVHDRPAPMTAQQGLEIRNHGDLSAFNVHEDQVRREPLVFDEAPQRYTRHGGGRRPSGSRRPRSFSVAQP